MNANELADLLEDDYWDGRANKVMLEGAKMLRQQQAEIEALKQIIDANNLNQNIGQFVKPTNKPVAWMVDGVLFTSLGAALNISFDIEQPCIPLYTHQYERPHNTVLVPCDKLAEMQAEIETLKAHPVKELALTDEEMISIYEKDWSGIKCGLGMAVEQAILRKAPVKELTDEEIRHIQAQCHLKDVGYDGFIMRFAKAILLKAQEK